MRRAALAVMLLATAPIAPAPASAQQVRGTLVLATGQDPALPIPFVGTGSQGNADVADQLFLRLGVMAGTRTAGDRALTPALARSWRREDARTLVFELDPRARWHDGVPVTAQDVVFAWRVATNPRVNPNQAGLPAVESVTAPGVRTVRVRFREVSSEQLYSFGFAMQPLPAHLLGAVAPEAIATSDFARFPVGNGPYRWVRRVPGQFVELSADTAFFQGRPGIQRLVFRVARDPSARLNLLRSRQVDVLDNMPSPDFERVTAAPDLAAVSITSSAVVYALFNTRNPRDTAAAHPILSDRRVREALTALLDRDAMVASTFGPSAAVPDAFVSQLWQWMMPARPGTHGANAARARALLAEAGWRDTNGDGTLDRAGVPLTLTMILPATSASRVALAVQAEAMWRAAGVRVALERADFPAYLARRSSGDWDLDLTAVNQDASPRSLAQSWSCASAAMPGSSNVARWCDPEFDRLRDAAAAAAGDPVPLWRRAFERMRLEAPAIFLAAPINQVAVHTRYANVQILPVKAWLNVWRWRVRPEAALPRDR